MMASVRVMSRRNHGLIRQCMKPSITTCPASVPVMVLLCPLASSATTNNVLAAAVPSKGASVRYAMRIQSLSGLNCDDLPARHRDAGLAVENHRRQHHDGGVDEEGDGQGGDGINGIKPDGAADGGFVLLQLAALHQGRVQIKVVRHDGRPDDADGHVNHPGLTQARRQPGRGPFPGSSGCSLRENKDFDEIANPDGRHEQQHHRLDGPHPKPLQGQQQATRPGP